MFPIDPQMTTRRHPVERLEAMRRADHLRALQGAKATKPARPRRFGRAKRIFKRGRSRAGLPGSPPGAGGRLLQL
jgi:hypothetical protein